MTKDFKKQAAKENAFGQYGLGWMLGGIAIGLLIGVGMYALANKGNSPAAFADSKQEPTSQTTSSADNGVQNLAMADTGDSAVLQDAVIEDNFQQDETPGFSYHAVLPQLEIEIPDSVKAAQEATHKKAEQPEQKPQRVPVGFNGLQVGSYKTRNQAVSAQERLQQKGLNSLIEEASVRGATWYRVRVGPADSPETLQQWQQTLSGMGISPMPVRM